MNGVGALIGLVLGSGMYLLATDPLPWRARRFASVVQRQLHPPAEGLASRGSRLVGEVRGLGIAHRQRLAGEAADPGVHLLALATGAAAGLGVGAGIVVTMLVIGSVRNPAAASLLLAVCGVSGWLLADRRLDARVRRRQRRAALELPTIAEALALAVSAGAALPQALDVVGRRSDGVLAQELRRAVHVITEGTTIDQALADLGARIPVPSVLRLADAIRIALERGTPVVDVLHAQASDARNESRRLLMEEAGRREIAMLIPVVFFVLPAVVVIALYPGYRELTTLTW